jgi:carnosine synthase
VYRELLTIRDARLLIAASGASQIGDWLYNAALLGYVYAATGSAGWVGAATICRLIPYVLLGPVGGAIADRFPRRSVLVTGDILRLAIMVALAVIVAADGPVELVIGMTAFASAAGTAERPAALALLPRLVGASRLGAANALLHTVQDLGIVIGPAIGALLLAVGPQWLPFGVNALTFAASASFVLALKDRSRPARARDSAVAHVTQGLRVARSTPLLLPLMLVAGVGEFIYGAQTVQLVVYARRSLDMGDGGYGVLLAAAGAGGVISAFVNARLATARRVTFVVAGTAALVAATELVYAGNTVIALALIATAIGGAALVTCEVVAETTLARIVAPEVLGRVVGVFESASVAAMVAGALLAPMAIEATSLKTSFLILGGASIAAVVFGRLALAGLDAASNRRTDELASRVDVIRRLPIAAGLPDLTLERLAAASQVCALPAGVDVVVQGAPAHALYGLIDGAVVVHRNGTTVDHQGPGTMFGERGLLDNAPRNASVTTESDSTLLRIEGEEFIEALQSVPRLRSTVDEGTTRASDRAPALDAPLEIEGTTVLVVSAGYPGKRPIYERMAQLGARLVIANEPGHWSEKLIDEGVATGWIAVTVTGDPDADAEDVLAALRREELRPDGVLTFWEDSVPVVARVAAALGLPGNPVEAVDAARSKLQTRQLSARLGLPTPRAHRVRSLDELYAAAADLGFPAVVKPEYGALAAGCMRVDSSESLPDIYKLVSSVVNAETDAIFRAGNDLLLEEYLDGVEFDVDIVFENAECVFSSVSQNWPTAEPSFQETGLHCPPDHSRRAVRELVAFCVHAAQAFGFRTGVLHIEGKSTSRGPRIVEINARMGGGRIHNIVEAVWGVDLVEAHLRSCLGRPQVLNPSRTPKCAIVDKIIYASASGVLESLPVVGQDPSILDLDMEAEIGETVSGPDATFATPIAELIITGRDLKQAMAAADSAIREPASVAPAL